MPMIMQCHMCEIGFKCVNKPNIKCVDYKMFASEKPKEITNEMKENLPDNVNYDNDGHLVLSKEFSLRECHFCNTVDHTLVYQHVGKNIYCCAECKSKMTADDDSKTMELIDMLCGVEKFAKKERVSRGLEDIISVVVDSVKKGLVGETKPLLDLLSVIKAIGKKESISDIIRSNIFNDRELGYLKTDITNAQRQLQHEETLRLTDECEDEE